MKKARYFLLGLVTGAALTTALFVFFGDSIRDTLAKATEATGERVQKVGESIEEGGEQLR